MSHFNAAKTHCKRGHLFDEKNTLVFVQRDGIVKRYCRACRREQRKLDWPKENARLREATR